VSPDAEPAWRRSVAGLEGRLGLAIVSGAGWRPSLPGAQRRRALGMVSVPGDDLKELQVPA